MDKALLVFSRKGQMRECIAARHVRSREHARKLWPMVDPDDRRHLVTWVSPSFEDGRLRKRSHFRRLVDGRAGVDLREHFEEEESERQRRVAESPEHARAKALLVDELQRRIAAGRGLPWAFKDESVSDFPLVGDLLLGAAQVQPEYPLSTPFGSSYRLDIAIVAPPISRQPLLVGGIEVERWHHFDGRKALIGRSMGFPLITVDITAMTLEELTQEWAARVLSDTTRNDAQGRRLSYVYLHDVLYPQFIRLPDDVEDDPKHQYLVFAADATLDRLRAWLRQLAEALGYEQTSAVLQLLNAKSPSALKALQNAGGIVGDGWEGFNNQRMLRISIPRPKGTHDERGHKFHATLGRLLLSSDCLVGYQYASAIYNNDPEEDVWLKYRYRREHGMCEVFRILPKRLAEPVGRLIDFLDSIAPTSTEAME